MSIETVLLPTTLDGDYGIKFKTVLQIDAEITPADVALREAYGQAAYPDSPEQVEIQRVLMTTTAGWALVDTFDHPSIELAVQEELAARRERNKEDAV